VSQLFEQFLRNLLESQVLQPNQRLLVGVSGGPDSLFLLLCLLKYSKQFHWTLAIAHLNHGLRGEIADEEGAFVEAVAQYWQLPCFIEKVELMTLNKARKKGSEEAGRSARHEFFSRITRNWQADAVVLGHHADDQVENFILRLLRGSGPEGLLPMKQTWLASEDLQIVRPLLRMKHRDIVDFLDHEGVIYCQDLTNEGELYLRSKVRSQLLPILEAEAPNIRNQILNLQEMLKWDQDYLMHEFVKYEEVDKDPFGLISISCQELSKWPQAFSSRWLIKQFYALAQGGEPIQFQHISSMMTKLREQPSFWRASLPANITAMISGGRFFLLTKQQMTSQSEVAVIFCFPKLEQLPCQQVFPDLFCNLYVEKHTGFDQSQGGLFGSKALGKEMLLRTAQAGDTIFFKHGFTKKVSDYFQERHIPIPWRSRIPILCEGDRIVMIPNHYTAGEYQPVHAEEVFRILIENYPA
jgi:tRNA(Ile)-lysidine synthase